MLPVMQRALDHFGTPFSESLHGGLMWPTGEPTKGGHYKWIRTPEQIDDDLAYLIAGEPWLKTAFDPVSLSMRISFSWNHGPALPSLAKARANAKPGGGDVGVTFGRRCYLQPGLTFPFTHDEPALLDFLRELQAHLPFRMHNNHFRRVLPGKTPGALHARKMPFPVLLSPA